MPINKMPIKVIIADNHPIIRMGIIAALSIEKCIEVVGEAKNTSEILSICEICHPDLLLLDINMPNLLPIEIVGNLHHKFPDLRIILTSNENDVNIRKFINWDNICGFINKNETPEILIQAILTAAKGGTWFDQQTVKKIVRQIYAQYDVDNLLTDREWDIIFFLAKGFSNRRIAEKLCVSEAAVRFHLRNIYKKTNVQSRCEMVVWAIQRYTEY